jgi:carbamoylphosphate synthase large subunit
MLTGDPPYSKRLSHFDGAARRAAAKVAAGYLPGEIRDGTTRETPVGFEPTTDCVA